MTALDHGYTIFDNCYSPSECDRIISQISGIAGAGTRCLLDNSWCQELARSIKDRVVPALPELEPLVAVQCTFFHKSLTSNWLVAFHQDRSIPIGSSVSENEWPGWSRKEGMIFVHAPDALLDQMVALRLHVDDSTRENGPLRVIPDSHRSGTLSSDSIDVLRNSSSECQLTVKQGGVVAAPVASCFIQVTNDR